MAETIQKKLCTEPVDRLSTLPENVLCQVLSILPTKGAVATSVLSKRWQYVWTGVSVLDFTDFPPPISATPLNKELYFRYKNFVHRVLSLNNVQCLECVHLECPGGFSASHVYEWMLVLAQKRVKEIPLKFDYLDSPVKLPETFLFDKDMLVVLKLRDFTNNLLLFLPSEVYLRKLISLSLYRVEIVSAGFFGRLLSGCPVLEELRVHLWQTLDEISLCSSSLRRLRFVHLSEENEYINLETPNLQFLHLAMNIAQSWTDDISSLVEATLQITTSSVRWAKLLQRFHCLKTLKLRQIILDLMFGWPKLIRKSNGLALERIECHDFDVAEPEEHSEMLKFFLNNSKHLKELTVYLQRWASPTSENRVLKKLLVLPRASTVCQISVVGIDDMVEEDFESASDYYNKPRSEDEESSSKGKDASSDDDCILLTN